MSKKHLYHFLTGAKGLDPMFVRCHLPIKRVLCGAPLLRGFIATPSIPTRLVASPPCSVVVQRYFSFEKYSPGMSSSAVFVLFCFLVPFSFYFQYVFLVLPLRKQ